jgi:hypothetical protein
MTTHAPQALHAHQEEHHKIVTRMLRILSDETQLAFSDVRADFVEGDLDCTAAFWYLLASYYPGRFSGVSWCHTCRKFNLEERTH